MLISLLIALAIALAPGASRSAIGAEGTNFGPGDPVIKDAAQFDSKRPIERELQASVPDGFVIASVGDLIPSRPLSQYAQRLPAFGAVIERLQKADVT